MGVAAPTQPLFPHPYHPNPIPKSGGPGPPNSISSMSQGFHQGLFSFSDGFDRSHQEQQQQQHIAHQSRRDKLRGQGFESAPPPLVAIEEEEPAELPVYEAGGMLSEMFNFAAGAAPTTADLLDNQIQANYRLQRAGATVSEWYGGAKDRQQISGGGGGRENNHSNNSSSNNNNSTITHQQIAGMNAESAAAMHLFLMNPQPRSPPSPSPPAASSAPFHMLLTNPSPPLQAFQAAGPAATDFGSAPHIPHSNFTWMGSAGDGSDGSKIRVGESQGLSLSLSSSLQQFEAAAAKAEELRMGDGVFYFNQVGGGGGGPSSSSSSYPLKNLGSQTPQHGHHHEGLHGHHQQHHHHVHLGGYGSPGLVNVLRNSKYAKAAQELLEEFCSVGRGHLKSSRHGRSTSNPNPSTSLAPPSSASSFGGPSSSSSKDPPPLSPTDRFEHQRRKAKLLSMLDEVDRRYNHYCEQMQMVVNSFDSVMGFGAATPYTALAQKAMSRHFRCLKDAIAAQLKHTCELLGDKDPTSSSGITKGETPRLRLIEQTLRHQRAFHQIGMMEQEAWRPQRGLPERSVNILRAWLFEHFLHPYPSDADKHLLARQTGLSRNQVSNWFINARVRLWKPMVEEMYQQESKDVDNPERESKNMDGEILDRSNTTQTPQTSAGAVGSGRSEMNAQDNDPTLVVAVNSGNSRQQRYYVDGQSNCSENMGVGGGGSILTVGEVGQQQGSDGGALLMEDEEGCRGGGVVMGGEFGTAATAAAAAAATAAAVAAGAMVGPTGHMRFGTTADHVSLTLGLRHAGNMPAAAAAHDKGRFSVRDFSGR